MPPRKKKKENDDDINETTSKSSLPFYDLTEGLENVKESKLLSIDQEMEEEKIEKVKKPQKPRKRKNPMEAGDAATESNEPAVGKKKRYKRPDFVSDFQPRTPSGRLPDNKLAKFGRYLQPLVESWKVDTLLSFCADPGDRNGGMKFGVISRKNPLLNIGLSYKLDLYPEIGAPNPERYETLSRFRAHIERYRDLFNGVHYGIAEEQLLRTKSGKRPKPTMAEVCSTLKNCMYKQAYNSFEIVAERSTHSIYPGIYPQLTREAERSDAQWESDMYLHNKKCSIAASDRMLYKFEHDIMIANFKIVRDAALANGRPTKDKTVWITDKETKLEKAYLPIDDQMEAFIPDIALNTYLFGMDLMSARIDDKKVLCKLHVFVCSNVFFREYIGLYQIPRIPSMRLLVLRTGDLPFVPGMRRCNSVVFHNHLRLENEMETLTRLFMLEAIAGSFPYGMMASNEIYFDPITDWTEVTELPTKLYVITCADVFFGEPIGLFKPASPTSFLILVRINEKVGTDSLYQSSSAVNLDASNFTRICYESATKLRSSDDVFCNFLINCG